MPTRHSFHAALYFVIASASLVLIVRTWLLLGLVVPITVSGSSMAPALRGPHVVASCPNCATQFEVGAEFASSSDIAACPQCGMPRVPLAESSLQSGDRLWIDRTLFDRRQPRRWEVVVLRQPDDASRLCVKRIVGLPGETIQILAGDLWVDGHIAVKSLDEQLKMRQQVYRSSNLPQHWQPEAASDWRTTADSSWHHPSTDSSALDWLRYLHPGPVVRDPRPITDEVSYNASISRRLNLVRDFMLTANLRAAGDGIFALQLDDGCQSLRITVCPSTGEVSLSENDEQLLSKKLPGDAISRSDRSPIPLMLSCFDRQLLLALAGKVVLRHQLAEDLSLRGSGRPFAIGTLSLDVSLQELTIYRDIHYSPAPLGTRPLAPEIPIRLGEGEYYVLGDNPPISIDSRVWGPVEGRLLIGGPLGQR